MVKASKAVEMVAPVNPTVEIITPKEPEVVVTVQSTGQVQLQSPSISHPTLGKGFQIEVEEFNFQSNSRGRQKGTGMIEQIIPVIQSVRDTPEKHGKQLKVAEFDSPQAATTMSAKLRKLHPELVKDMSLLVMKKKDAQGKENGSMLGIKYGIPVA